MGKRRTKYGNGAGYLNRAGVWEPIVLCRISGNGLSSNKIPVPTDLQGVGWPSRATPNDSIDLRFSFARSVEAEEIVCPIEAR